MELSFDIFETAAYGLVLRVLDAELADQFDDYLTEHCCVFYKMKLEKDYVEFYFGQLCDPLKLKGLIERFCGERGVS